MRVSKSRNVCGYVKAERRRRALRAKLDAKLEALAPLRRALDVATADAFGRVMKLTGGQAGEANRILDGYLDHQALKVTTVVGGVAVAS